MQIEDLNEIIVSLKEASGDMAGVEAKAAKTDLPKRLWETLSAFANTPGGGTIILGWDEESLQPVGVNNPKKIQQDLGAMCTQMMPPIRALIQIHTINSKKLVTAEIPEISFKEKPCHYQGSGLMSGSFIRVADGNRGLTQYEVQGFLDGRGQPRYDLEPVLDSSGEDLSENLLSDFLKACRNKFPAWREWDDAKILQSTRITAEQDGKTLLTVAGLLALGAHPQRHFPGLVAHVMVYPREKEGQTGDTDERFLDNIKIEGPLITMVPAIINAIKRNVSKRSVIKGLFREEILEYPELFFREAITNALVHRDYSPLARGSAVQVKIFPNRIEITNPGGLFGPVTEDKLGQVGLQASRNGFLIKILEDCPVPGENGPLCENRGTGILHMIRALRKAGMEPPSFSDHRTYFRVTCFNNSLFNPETLRWLEGFTSFDLSEHQRYALAFLRHRLRLTNNDYCQMNDCDSREATGELTELARRGLIQSNGTGRWTFYTLPSALDESVKAERQVRRDRRKDILSVFAAKESLTRRDLEDALKIQSATVLYWLRILHSEKEIEPIGNSRSPNVRYKLSVRRKRREK